MKRFRFASLFSGITAALLAIAPTAVRAQDEADPAMPAADTAVDPAAADPAMPEAAADPTDAAPADDGDAPAKPAGGKAGPAPVNDAAVQSLIESKPKTPREFFQVILYLVDLHRGDAAAPFAKQLLAANPTAKDCSIIVREHGGSAVFRVGRAEGIGANGKKLADLIIAGANKHRRDPAQLAALIKQLTHQAAEVRRVALNDLVSAETDGVVALVGVLADPAAAAQHAAIRDALVAFGSTAVDPLTATLMTRDEALAIGVIDVLGRIRDSSAVAYLMGPALSKNAKINSAARSAVAAILGREPTDDDAAAFLENEISARMSGGKRLRSNSAGRVLVWNWNDTQHKLTVRDFAHEDALSLIAARLANELVAARPQSADAQRLDVIASLQAAKLGTGVETPLDDKSPMLKRAAGRDIPILDAALSESLRKRYVPAAVGIIEAIGNVANEQALLGQGDRPGVLVGAIRDPQRVIRFAALGAIMKITPTQPFAGSSSVVDALAFFATSAGDRRVLVLEPRSFQAQSLAGMLRDTGYAADAGILGRSGRVMLNTSADYEFAFIDLGVGGPDAYELVGELRRDPRTATLPIGLMAGENQLPRAKRIAAAFPRTIAFPQATEKKTIDYQADQLRALQDRLTMSPAVRQRQAELAMAWLAQLAARNQSIYDLSRCEKQMIAGLDEANLARAAAECLAHAGTHTAQVALVEFASQTNRPLGLRQAAAAAFGKSVGKHGIQLTSDEIVRQYDRYNASEQLNEATQKVFGALLDTIEAPSRSARAKESAIKKASLNITDHAK